MIKTKLMEHQIEILNFIKNKKYFGLFADYGIGKTLCALAYINVHISIKNVLVIAPKTLILSERTWDSEIKKHTDFISIPIIGSSKEKEKIISEVKYADRLFNIRIFLLNYESIQVALPYAKYFNMIIFDESDWIKNYKAIMTKLAHKISKLIPNKTIMAGYPVTEHLQDIYTQIYALDQGTSLGDSYWCFLNKYFQSIDNNQRFWH